MIFAEIYLKFFADHAAEEEARRRGIQAGLPHATQASGERHAAATNQGAPPPPLPEKVVPDGAGGNIRSGEDVAAQGNFTRTHPSRSGGEKSIDENTVTDRTAGEKRDGIRVGKGQQGARTKSCTLLSRTSSSRRPRHCQGPDAVSPEHRQPQGQQGVADPR